jgi:SOS-response transcriptional repressor LexA
MSPSEYQRTRSEAANTTPKKAAEYRNRYPITPRQQEVLAALAAFQAEGKSPTLNELATACGLKSTYGIRRHLVILQKKGLAKRGFNEPRSIRLAEAA